MNGRRVRGANHATIKKLNRQIQLINESIANCYEILEREERTVRPGDYLGGRIEDSCHYGTWRTVGVFNITDHFIVRYFQRVENITIKERLLKKEYPNYLPKNRDMYTVWFMTKYGIIDDDSKSRMREFVMNPPDDVRIIRHNDRVVTILN